MVVRRWKNFDSGRPLVEHCAQPSNRLYLLDYEVGGACHTQPLAVRANHCLGVRFSPMKLGVTAIITSLKIDNKVPLIDC
jgi:hypothetical protein